LTNIAALGRICSRIVATHVGRFGWIVVAEMEVEVEVKLEREVAVRFSDAEKK